MTAPPSPKPQSSRRTLLIVGFTLLLAGFVYLYGEHWLREILLYLSTAVWAREFVTRFPLAWRVASRFIAGEQTEDAIRVTRELNQDGRTATINYLGEHVTTAQEAADAREAIIRLLDQIHKSGLDANVSVKPTQIGLQVSEKLMLDNLRTILIHAEKTNNRVRIDMEDSPTVDTTLNIYRTLRDDYGFGQHVGIVIQAYLYRSEADVEKLIDEGAWVRLCKGAYLEPPHKAYPEKEDTDANFVHLVQKMLSPQARQNGLHLAVATHDEKMIQATLDYARQHQVPVDAFEFQMLYGIGRELQRKLVEQGYRVRIYVPYGTAWYPYFVRRLAERPANLWFFISNLIRG